MNLRLQKLVLLCRQKREEIFFGPRLSFFHGEMATGKSTIVAMIDFCFGGRLVRTPAVRDEVISVQLLLSLNGEDFLIERSISSTTEVSVSWTDGKTPQLQNFPLRAGANPVLEDDIYSLSDFLMRKLGYPLLKVRQRKQDPEADMRRVSFRNFFRFLYLDQDELDSSLFHLEVPIRGEQSKDVLKYIFGLHSDRLSALQGELADLRNQQRTIRDGADQINEFLGQYGFSSQSEITGQIDAVEVELLRKQHQMDELTPKSMPESTVAEDDRAALTKLDIAIEDREEALDEVIARIREQEALAAEFVSMKFRVARAATATDLLSGAEFHMCPRCGTDVAPADDVDTCSLCKTDLSKPAAKQQLDAAVVTQDLSDRVDDLARSTKRFLNQRTRHEKKLAELKIKRTEAQRRVDAARSSIESEYMKRVRALESEIGSLRERSRFLSRVLAMPGEIERRRAAADRMFESIGGIERQIAEEEGRFEAGRINVAALEFNFLTILRAIHFPDISKDDRVYVNPKTWIPSVLRGGDESKALTFEDAGSGGKKVLFKICFALAIHLTAAQRKLSLPKLLMIDSTMKNITPDINKDVVLHFYKELYRLLHQELEGWQLILVDQSYFAATPEFPGQVVRRLTKRDPQHPPLISYYTGS